MRHGFSTRKLSPRVAFVAMAMALCPLVSRAAENSPPLPWWDTSWSHRQIVHIATPDPSGSVNTATVRLDTDGKAAEDGRDIRVLNAHGNPQRFTVEPVGEGFFEVDFEVTDPSAATFAVYYGKPDAASAQKTWPRKTGGLRLKTVRNTSRAWIHNYTQMQRVVKASHKVFGEADWPMIDDAANPFAKNARDHENYISIYKGKLYCPATGTYRFITVADDRAFLLINNRLLVDGGYNPNLDWDPRYSGRVHLEQGVHDIAFYHVEYKGGQMARAGWKRPGDRTFSTIAPEYFIRELRAEPIACQARLKPLNSYFSAKEDETLQFNTRDKRLVRVAFEDCSTSAFGNVVLWEWDFGDGSPPSREAKPEHTYATAGAYNVTLECRDDYGYVDIARRTLDISGSHPQHVNVFADIDEENVVLTKDEEVRLQLRLKHTWHAPLEATLHIDVLGAAGDVIRSSSEPVALKADDWIPKSIQCRLPRQSGAVRFRLEHLGLDIVSHTVRISRARELFARLTPKNSGLVDPDGNRVLIRVGGEPLDRSGSVLRKLRRGGAVRVLVVDDYLSPPAGEDAATPYFELLAAALRQDFPRAQVTVDRIDRGDFLSYPPLERLGTVPARARKDEADLVIVAGGIEDILNYMPKDRFERYLWALAERLQGATTAEVMLVTPPPFVFNPALSRDYARAVKRIALRTGVSVADVYSAFSLLGDDWGELYRDEQDSDPVYYLSPRRHGQEIIAQRLHEEITGENNWRPSKTAVE